MTKRKWIHKNFSADYDLKRILDLRFKVFQEADYQKDRWVWQYQKNPMGESYINLAVDTENSDHLAGHYAVISYKIKTPNKIEQAVQSLDTFTDSTHRRQGIFVDLAKLTYEQARLSGVKYVFGFPNKYSYPAFPKKLDFIDPFGFGIYKLPLNTNYFAKKLFRNLKIPKFNFILNSKKTQSSLKRLKYLPEDYNSLKTSFEKIFPYMIEKSKSYLNWRYFDCPDRNYSCLELRNKNGQLEGLLFAQVDYHSNYVHFVDFIVREKKDFKALFKKGIEYFKDQNYNCITVYLNESNKLDNTLKDLNFSYSDKSRDFRIVLKNLISDEYQDMKKSNNWFITAGDTDFY